MNLAYAQNDEVYLEDLCYQAQQAAEKAIKAIFISLRRTFPYSQISIIFSLFLRMKV
jgi:HEPN domain-containing protein